MLDDFKNLEKMKVFLEQSLDVMSNTEPNTENVPIYNKEALTGNKPCFICGYIVTAEIVRKEGAGLCDVVAVSSVAGAERFIDYVRENPVKCPLVICFDNDNFGFDVRDKIIEEFEILEIPFVYADWTEDGKGVEDILSANSKQFKEDLKTIITDAERIRPVVLPECALSTGKALFNAFWDDIQQEITMMPTGFRNLDYHLDGGLFEGVYVIGAGSGMGKTTFAVQMADNIAKTGQPVVYFSLEMSAFELMAKSLSRITYEITIEKNLSESMAKDVRGITNIRLYQKYSELELDIIEEAKRRYMEFADNLFFHEGNFGSGVEELEVFVSAVKEYTGKTPVIIVDFFQILAPMREFRNCNRSDKQNADDNITALKRLSRDLKTPIVAISSLNRQNYETNAGLAAMKESGGIDYTYDVAMMLQPYGVADAVKKDEIKRAYADYKKQVVKKMELKNEKNRKGRGYFKYVIFGNLKYNYFYEDKVFVDVTDDDSGCPFEMTQAEL